MAVLMVILEEAYLENCHHHRDRYCCDSYYAYEATSGGSGRL